MRTDAELLRAYAAAGDEPAFAELVSRHGAMVYRSCLRVLGDEHDAEESAQAVFVVLARKARSLREAGSLAAWLHGVARNISARHLRDRLQRARREEAAIMVRAAGGRDGGAGAGAESGRSEVLADLDREVAALPVAQRQAVILHYLEGLSHEQAAEAANCPRGTLSRRASEGLERLRQRLCGRGQVLGSAALVGLLGAEAAAAVPTTLLPSIVAVSKFAAAGAAGGTAGIVGAVGAQQAVALQLAEGAIKAMFWVKMKLAAAVLVGAAMAGAGGTAVIIAAAESPQAEAPKAGSPEPKSSVSEQGIGCQVVALLGGGKVTLSAGAEQGVRPRFELDVERDGKKVATLRITAVEPKSSTAELVSATGELKVGDKARTRFGTVLTQPPAEPEAAKPVMFGEKDNGSRVRMPAGQVFEIRLQGREAGTGWEFESLAEAKDQAARESGTIIDGKLFVRDSDILARERSTDFEPAAGATDQAIGTYIGRYRTLKPGVAVIRGVYVRPGGHGFSGLRGKTALRGEYKLTVEVVAAAPAAGGEAVNGIKLVLIPRKATHKLQETWEFDARAVNVRKEPLSLDYYDQRLRLEVRGPAGQVTQVPRTAIVRDARAIKKDGHFAVVAPGGEQDLSVSALPGLYVPGLPAIRLTPGSDKGDGSGGWPPIPAGDYRVKAVLENKGPDDTAEYGVRAEEWIGSVTSKEVVIRVLSPEGAGAEKPAAGAPGESKPNPDTRKGSSLKGLADSQEADGSWEPRSKADIAGGKVYTTALGALTLQIYPGFRPMY